MHQRKNVIASVIGLASLILMGSPTLASQPTHTRPQKVRNVNIKSRLNAVMAAHGRSPLNQLGMNLETLSLDADRMTIRFALQRHTAATLQLPGTLAKGTVAGSPRIVTVNEAPFKEGNGRKIAVAAARLLRRVFGEHVEFSEHKDSGHVTAQTGKAGPVFRFDRKTGALEGFSQPAGEGLVTITDQGRYVTIGKYTYRAEGTDWWFAKTPETIPGS